MRLFLAASPDEPARRAIASVQADIEHTIPGVAPALRWVMAGGSHLTLHFLGEVDTAGTERLVRTLDTTVDLAPFDLTLRPPEVSPRAGPPHVVWMPVAADHEDLIALHDKLGGRVIAAGLTLEPRRFAPHLTLARVRERERWRARGLRDELAKLRVPSIRWRVDRVTLFRSDLSGPAPEHHALHAIILGRPAEGPQPLP